MILYDVSHVIKILTAYVQFSLRYVEIAPFLWLGHEDGYAWSSMHYQWYVDQQNPTLSEYVNKAHQRFCFYKFIILCFETYSGFCVPKIIFIIIILVTCKLLGLQCFHAVGGRQEGHPACKNWVLGCGRGYLSGPRCRLAYGPADATATHCLLLQ